MKTALQDCEENDNEEEEEEEEEEEGENAKGEREEEEKEKGKEGDTKCLEDLIWNIFNSDINITWHLFPLLFVL